MKGFIKIEEDALAMGMPPAETMVYSLVMGYLNNKLPFNYTLDEVAGKVNMTPKGVRKVIARLECRGLLAVTRHSFGLEIKKGDGVKGTKFLSRKEQSSYHDGNKVPIRREQSSYHEGNKVPITPIIIDNNIDMVDSGEATSPSEKPSGKEIMMDAFRGWYERHFDHPYIFEQDFTDNFRIISKAIYDQMVREGMTPNEANLKHSTEMFFDCATKDNWRNTHFTLALCAKQVNAIMSQIINPNIDNKNHGNTPEYIAASIAVLGSKGPLF